MKIYFAGSIRGGRSDAKNYYLIIEFLKNYGEVLTEHVGNEALLSQENSMDDEAIFKRDMQWLNSCDMICAEVTQPSLGVGYELAMAKNAHKPVLCLFNSSKDKRLSAMITGDKYFEILNYSDSAQLPKLLENYFKNNK